MNRYFYLPLMLVLFSLSLQAQPNSVPLRMLSEYYILNNNALQPGINFRVITDRKQFIKLFGEMRKADTPDFSKEMVLVMAMPAEHKEPKLSFEPAAMRAGKFIEVYCSVVAGTETVSYLYYPIAIGAIPRLEDLSKINFYNRQGMQLMQSVEVKRKRGA